MTQGDSRPDNSDQRPASGRSKPVSFRRAFAAYLKDLEARQEPAGRLAELERKVKRIAGKCGFVRLTDVRRGFLVNWLRTSLARGTPPAVQAEHVEALAGFLDWCVQRKLLAGNPAENLAIPRQTQSAQSDARPLTDDELERLLHMARWRPLAEYGRAVPKSASKKANPQEGGAFVPLTLETLDSLVARGREQLAKTPIALVQADIEGWQRAVVYKLLVLTGLRRSELAALRVHSIDLKAKSPFLVAGGPAAGSLQGARLPLRVDLVTDLRRWLRYRLDVVRKTARQKGQPIPKNLSGQRRIFHLPAGLIKALELDLKAAGLSATDEQGRRLDLHAARSDPDFWLGHPGRPIPPPERPA